MLADAVDDALHEALAAADLVVAEADAEQPLDEHVVGAGLGAPPPHRLGDAQRFAADDAHGDRVDHPVGVPDDRGDGGVEPRLQRDLLGRADGTEQQLGVAEHLLQGLHRVVAGVDANGSNEPSLSAIDAGIGPEAADMGRARGRPGASRRCWIEKIW